MKKRWRRLALVAAALALIGVAVYGFGALVEREHRASVDAVIPAAPERVLAALVDVDAYPRWREGVESVEVLSREPLRWREHGDDGDLLFEEVERVEGRRFVSRIADPDLPFGGTWTYELTPNGDATRVTITEEGWIGPPPFRLMMKYLVGYDASMRAYLEGLARRVAQSEAVDRSPAPVETSRRAAPPSIDGPLRASEGSAP